MFEKISIKKILIFKVKIKLLFNHKFKKFEEVNFFFFSINFKIFDIMTLMIFFFIFGITSKLRKNSKKKIISNEDDLINLNQFLNLGWYNMTWDSVDELNRALYSFKMTNLNQIKLLIGLCTYISKKGYYINEKVEEQYDSRFKRFPLLFRNPYRGSGYLLMKDDENYKDLSKFIGDNNIYSKGADYVSQYYPWASALFYFRKLNLHGFKDFEKKTFFKLILMYQGDSEYDADSFLRKNFFNNILINISPWKELSQIFSEISTIL